MMDDGSRPTTYLVFTASGTTCLLPASAVVETLRPLPVRPVPDLPRGVLGSTIVRGEVLPVIDVATLLATGPAAPGRFVVARAGARRLVLAVTTVPGIRRWSLDRVAALPPLLRSAAVDVVAGVVARDGDLSLVLAAGRMIPAEVWESFTAPGGTP